jgi:hypothetical protein
MQYSTLKTKLVQLVHGSSNLDGLTLSRTLADLDHWATDTSLPPKLRHYLEKRSYLKALNFLEESH